ncbi:MAG TPA: GNAT family N-acetyltransferase [Herpetosiphonaceae bacterium]
MQLRRAAAGDEEALAHIRRSAILALAVPVLSPEEAEQWAGSAAADRIARAIREHEVWVAVAESAVGWVEVDGDRVAALYVAPAWAGRGVGSALLACAEAAIQRSGHPAARLESSRNALAFYLRRGYKRCGQPDAVEAYPMRKDLISVAPKQDATQQERQ